MKIQTTKIQTTLTLLLSTLCLAVFVAAEAAAQVAEAPKAKILYFTRSNGEGHSPARMRDDGTTLSGAALKKYCEERNIELVESHDGTIFDGDVSEYDAFVFFTSGGLQNANNRVPTMLPMSDDGIMNLIESVRSGKGFVAIHSGADTHSNVRIDRRCPYVAMVGGRSAGHGPQQFMTFQAAEPVELPWLKEVDGRFTAHDQWYAMHELNPDMRVIFAMQTKDLYPHPDNIRHYGRPDFPLCWIRMEDKGRVAYVPMGRDDRFWWNEWNVRTVGEFIEWSLGRFDMDVTPNINTVCPGYAEMPNR